MGRIKKVLNKTTLPDRELHNSRMFVDLGENVHIHFRELRQMFGVEEFFEYADIITRSAKFLKDHLAKNPGYQEWESFSDGLIALGPEQQTTPLTKSPQPNQSKYFPNRLQIELQAQEVIDYIHIHFRDYRLVMNFETFRKFAEGMKEALEKLDKFIGKHPYPEKDHPFRKEVAKPGWFSKIRGSTS